MRSEQFHGVLDAVYEWGSKNPAMALPLPSGSMRSVRLRYLPRSAIMTLRSGNRGSPIGPSELFDNAFAWGVLMVDIRDCEISSVAGRFHIILERGGKDRSRMA